MGRWFLFECRVLWKFQAVWFNFEEGVLWPEDDNISWIRSDTRWCWRTSFCILFQQKYLQVIFSYYHIFFFKQVLEVMMAFPSTGFSSQFQPGEGPASTWGAGRGRGEDRRRAGGTIYLFPRLQDMGVKYNGREGSIFPGFPSRFESTENSAKEWSIYRKQRVNFTMF